ncbi:MAG TPA: hypothetical protein VMT71_18360 [Syntrophorhabdales bacterium]|nr:hypothetical protein [Syntrophorhabdales bacterium]
MKKKASWFDWFVTGSFWLMGVTIVFGMIVIALRTTESSTRLAVESLRSPSKPLSSGNTHVASIVL